MGEPVTDFGAQLANGIISTAVFAAGGAAGRAIKVAPAVSAAILGALPQADRGAKAYRLFRADQSLDHNGFHV